MLDRCAQALLNESLRRTQGVGTPALDIGSTALVAQEDVVHTIGRPDSGLLDRVLQLLGVHPEPAIAIAPSVLDFQIPANDQALRLRVIDFQDDFFEVL